MDVVTWFVRSAQDDDGTLKQNLCSAEVLPCPTESTGWWCQGPVLPLFFEFEFKCRCGFTLGTLDSSWLRDPTMRNEY